MQHLTILSENPLEQIWLHLSLRESQKMAQQLIEARATDEGLQLDAQLLDDKAKGLSYCLRNAREYFEQPANSWNSKLLNNYYGLMAFVGAILIADPKSAYTLPKFEDAMKQGHGMSTITMAPSNLDEELIYILNDGLFYRYLNHIGLNVASKAQKRKSGPKDVDVDDRQKMISLHSLLGTIPELADLFHSVTGQRPLSIPLVYETVNERFSDRLGGEKGVWINLTSPYYKNKEDYQTLELPFSKYSENAHNLADVRGFLSGLNLDECSDKLALHRSSMSRLTTFKPPLGIVEDIVGVHMMLMYQLSIIVRYKPSVWREISEGKHDDYFSLIKAYYHVHSRTVPQIALGRILNREILLASPHDAVYS